MESDNAEARLRRAGAEGAELAQRYPPPRVFSEKRLQALENKGNECRKERKETTKRLLANERT